MSKTKISLYDADPGNNTDIDGINLAEGMAPGLVNNAIRELMAQLKDFQIGSAGDPLTVGGNLAVTGTSAVTGNATFAGDVAVTGNVTVGGAPLGFPAGTKMLFQQIAAPTGWTKDTTHDNKALRVVTGTAGTGGSIAFTTAFGSQNVGNTTLTIAQIPSHSHGLAGFVSVSAGGGFGNPAGSSPIVSSTAAAGGGGSHTHSLDLSVQYVDLIICTKS